MKLRLTVMAIVMVVAVSAGGCGGGSAETSGGTHSAGGVAPTLTKDNLPTEVGTTWSTVRSVDGPVPIDMTIEGPWEFTADSNWSTDTDEIVDPATVPEIDAFTGVSFVTKVTHPDSPDYYYPRALTVDWVDHLGRITVTDGTAVAEPTDKPQHFWPLDFEVGRSHDVGENDISVIEADVLSVNTATVPAGVIENTYLVRFTYTAKSDGTVTVYYYMFAPDVGFVALIHPSAGSDKGGFTAAEQVDVLATMPRVK